jgi:hypothetical protein
MFYITDPGNRYTVRFFSLDIEIILVHRGSSGYYLFASKGTQGRHLQDTAPSCL